MNGTTASQHRACLYVQLHITLIRFTHRYILHTATHIYQETGHKTGHKNRFLISDMNEATRVRLRSECVCVCEIKFMYIGTMCVIFVQIYLFVFIDVVNSLLLKNSSAQFWVGTIMLRITFTFDWN